MLRGFIAAIMVAGMLGCGGQDEVAELRAYTLMIKGFDSYNLQVEDTIRRFDDPTQELTSSDIAAARGLIDEYAAAAKAVTIPEETVLKNTHALYLRAFDEARRLASDETGDIKRQSHSVAIGMRNLRRDVEGRVYPSMEVLLSRAGLSGDEFELSWPEKN